jgi:hypothetical protein
MLNEETQKALSKFAKNVVQESKNNLRDQKKNASYKLWKSITYDLKVHKSSFSLDFLMEDYGHYQDKGVSGKIRKFNTPFSYKNNPPPPSAFDKWIVAKGIAPRQNGKFASRKTLQKAISRRIFNYGIKPSLFFTKPFEKHFKNIPNEVVEAYGLDVETFLKFTL